MDARHRFLACMRGEHIDRAPNYEMGYWAGTLERWYAEGLTPVSDQPRGLASGAGIKGEGFPWRTGEPRDASVHAYLDLDEGIEKIAGEWGIWPPFEQVTLWEDGELIRRREPDGTQVLVRKDLCSLPRVLDGPASDRRTWEQLKAERLRIDVGGRLPADWDARVRRYRDRTWPLAIGGPFLGVFSSLRALLGFERLMYTFHDDPALIHDILAHLVELWLALFEETLEDTDVDLAYYWEDMSYKAGAMFSPRVFHTFMQPVYQRINGFFRGRGIDVILVDTDGNVWGLLPLLLQAGITGLYPFEVRAGMDVRAVRQRYPRLQMLGGIDKTALTGSCEAIDAEIARVLPVIRSGAYIPGADHYIPPDVPWPNFLYYRRRLRSML